MTNPLLSLSEHLASTVEQSGRSVVAIHARARFNSSGVVWSPGIVVTADHTIHEEDDIRVTMLDGGVKTAEVAGRDPSTDLAVLRVKDLASPPAVRTESASPQPGGVILVVGRFKDSVSAAVGVVSSVSGPSQTWRGGRLDQVVRLDVALQPASAGAAVVDSSGKLIGIATAALSRISVFAIPVSTIERVTGLLLAHGRIPRGYLGVGLQPIAIPEHLKNSLGLSTPAGLIAISVDADAPAGRAGILIGDILLELAGRALHRPEDVQEALGSETIGQKMKARILRAGKTLDVEVSVAERPARR